jgi:hypothetical protein
VGGCFTLNTRIVLGNECDCPSYVRGIFPASSAVVNLEALCCPGTLAAPSESKQFGFRVFRVFRGVKCRFYAKKHSQSKTIFTF